MSDSICSSSRKVSVFGPQFLSSPLRVMLMALTVLALLVGSTNRAVARYAVAILDSATGKVLHAVNADTRNYPASLTKMMTLYLVFEDLDARRLSLDDRLKVSRRAAGQAPSKLGLKAGQTIRVRDAVAALVTKSANDVAVTIAENLGGTEQAFAKRMTAKARALGMSRTTFRNASGLPNRGQLSTARDMARLSLALLQHYPQRYHQFSRKSFTYKDKTYRNHNRLLTRYDGVDGIKTGYTRASGFNLAVSVERGGKRLVGVVFGGRTAKARDTHMARLLDRAFTGIARSAALKKQSGSGIRLISSAQAATGQATTLAKSNSDMRKPAPVRKKTAARAPDSSWGIQVGAFRHRSTAQRAIQLAAKKVPSQLRRRAAAMINQTEKSNLFRAQLVGMTERAARRSCRLLMAQKMACQIVRAAHGEHLAMYR